MMMFYTSAEHRLRREQTEQFRRRTQHYRNTTPLHTRHTRRETEYNSSEHFAFEILIVILCDECHRADFNCEKYLFARILHFTLRQTSGLRSVPDMIASLSRLANCGKLKMRKEKWTK